MVELFDGDTAFDVDDTEGDMGICLGAMVDEQHDSRGDLDLKDAVVVNGVQVLVRVEVPDFVVSFLGRKREHLAVHIIKLDEARPAKRF